VDVVVEKQVNALKESLVSFFKQGITTGHGMWFSSARIAFICHICNLGDHAVSICPRIKYLKSKCGKCDLPLSIENCDLRYDYYNGMGHTEERLVLEKKEGTQTKLCYKQLLGGTCW
jgi:hypothetical protein